MTTHSNERRRNVLPEWADTARDIEDQDRELARYAAAFEDAPIPTAITAHDGGQQVIAVNAAFEDLFGYTADDLPAHLVEQALSPSGEHSTPVQNSGSVHVSTSTAESEATELSLETQYGRREFCRIETPLDRSGFSECTAVFLIDSTTEKYQRERLQVISRVLRHDSRNQLNIVKGNASLLDGSLDEDTRAVLSEQIVDAADEFLATCEQIRDVEKALANDRNHRPIDVVALVEDVFADLQPTYPDCEFSLVRSDPVRVLGSSALRIAFESVIENAAAHNDSDAPAVEVTPIESLDGKYIDVRVADNGPGIPPAEYEILTGERDRSQVEHLSGLGLYMSNWLVTAHGGTLEFDANAPRGSIVTLRLPSAESPR